MATVFNKLEKVEENKFGTIKELVESFSTTTTPQSLEDDMNNAVPIWALLGMSEKEYQKKYQPDAPAVAESVVTVEESDKEV